MTSALLSLLLLAPVASADWPPGTELDPAVTADITKSGLSAIADNLDTLVPASIDVPPVEIWEGTDESDSWYYVEVSGVWVGLEVDDADIVPGNDVLNLDADIWAWINNSADPAFAGAWVDPVIFDPFWPAACDVYVTPFLVSATATITLDIVTVAGTPTLDAEIGGVTWTWDLNQEDIQLDCWIGSLLDILEWVEIYPLDYLLDYAADEIDSMLLDMVEELEVTIEDAFAEANLDQEIELNGAVLHLELHPSDIRIRPPGVRVEMAGLAEAEPDECVAEWGIDASLATDGEPPTVGGAPSGLGFTHHMGVFADDDFVNQALFAAWHGGVLCFSLASSDSLPLDTALLGILSPEFGRLFREAKPLQVATRPRKPPLAYADGPYDLNLLVEELGVDLMAEVDGRMALALGVDLATDTGADLDFTKTTGELAIEVGLTPADLITTVRHNEFAPGEEEQIEAAFGGLVENVVWPMLGGYLSDLGFILPSYEGLGLTRLEVAPSGDTEDHLGVFGTLGEVQYSGESSGCGCEGDGDGGEGCGEGCGTSALPVHGWIGLMPLVAAFLRRRRDP